MLGAMNLSHCKAFMQERQQHEDEVDYNRGIWWAARLSARPITTDSSSAKGIKRQSDKVIGHEPVELSLLNCSIL